MDIDVDAREKGVSSEKNYVCNNAFLENPSIKCLTRKDELCKKTRYTQFGQVSGFTSLAQFKVATCTASAGSIVDVTR